MRKAVYNSAIPQILLKSVNRAFCPSLRFVHLIFFLAMFDPVILARAADWSGPEQQLARKIVALTGPGAVAVTVENRSSLGTRDSEIVENGLRSALEGLGIHFVTADQAAATVTIALSENATSYVWVAEIHQGAAESAVVMVSVPRPAGAPTTHDSVPIVLRKTSLWTQDDLFLDVAVLEEDSTPTRIAVLAPEKVSIHRLQGGKWQLEQELAIVHARPWPRDLRGRLVPAKDHLLDVYLPGVICRSSTSVPLTLSCRETDDPWPLVSAGLTGFSVYPSAQSANRSLAIPSTQAFFAPTRNFFTGVLTPLVGRFSTVPKFYSAALFPREKYTLWLFAATDGQVHMVDGISDQAARFDWGSDITSVKTSCGVGWQVLATNSGERSGDLVRAYEFPDRDPVAVSAAVEFPGAITALWTEARGDTAVAITKSQGTGTYEAFRLALGCGQ